MLTPSLAAQFVQANHVTAGSNLPITRIVIHGTVSKTVAGGARSVAGYFQSPGSGGSAHYVVDPSTVVQCVAEAAIAWHAPPNPGSLGIELCDLVSWVQAGGKTARDYDARMVDEATFNGRWDRPDFDAMLRLAADLTIEMASKYGVPLTKVGPAQLLAGAHGICGHVDVSQAWHETDHTDPGTTFPWARFMDYLAHPGKTLTSAPTPITIPAPKDPAMGKPVIISVPNDKGTRDGVLLSGHGTSFIYPGQQSSIEKWLSLLDADGKVDPTTLANHTLTSADITILRQAGLTA